MLNELREQISQASQALAAERLLTLAWGSVSAIDREQGVVAVTCSDVPFHMQTSQDIVLVDMEGEVLQSDRQPSRDLPTHLCLYRAFERLGGIVHTHSLYATIFAQAQKEIPCYGTTHADYFFGSVPVTRPLAQNQVEEHYAANIGRSIVQRFERLDPLKMPGVLVANHGPYVWGGTVDEAVSRAIAIEKTAALAIETQRLNKDVEPITYYLMQHHFEKNES